MYNISFSFPVTNYQKHSPESEFAFSLYFNFQETRNLPAGISARRPEISLRASAQREVESAIILTLYPISLKYSDSVIPAKTNSVSMHYMWLTTRNWMNHPLSNAISPWGQLLGTVTCIDGGFSGSYRHVGGVGHQRCSLHDALYLPIHLHGQLLVKPHCQSPWIQI